MEDHSIRQNRRERNGKKFPEKIKKIQARRRNAASAGTQGMENRMVCPLKRKEPD